MQLCILCFHGYPSRLYSNPLSCTVLQAGKPTLAWSRRCWRNPQASSISHIFSHYLVKRCMVRTQLLLFLSSYYLSHSFFHEFTFSVTPLSFSDSVVCLSVHLGGYYFQALKDSQARCITSPRWHDNTLFHCLFYFQLLINRKRPVIDVWPFCTVFLSCMILIGPCDFRAWPWPQDAWWHARWGPGSS